MIEKKAEKLVPFVKKEQGSSHDFYTIPKLKDGKPNGSYTVIDNHTTGKVSCDCLYFSMKQKECSHILAVKLWEQKH